MSFNDLIMLIFSTLAISFVVFAIVRGIAGLVYEWRSTKWM